jgi:hypothetical protein
VPCGVRRVWLDTNAEPTRPTVFKGPDHRRVRQTVATIVLRFLARLAIGQLIERLERSGRTDNWDKLIDLYINLVVAVCRGIALAAPTAAATVTIVLRESLAALAIW